MFLIWGGALIDIGFSWLRFEIDSIDVAQSNW